MADDARPLTFPCDRIMLSSLQAGSRRQFHAEQNPACSLCAIKVSFPSMKKILDRYGTHAYEAHTPLISMLPLEGHCPSGSKSSCGVFSVSVWATKFLSLVTAPIDVSNAA